MQDICTTIAGFIRSQIDVVLEWWCRDADFFDGLVTALSPLGYVDRPVDGVVSIAPPVYSFPNFVNNSPHRRERDRLDFCFLGPSSRLPNPLQTPRPALSQLPSTAIPQRLFPAQLSFGCSASSAASASQTAPALRDSSLLALGRWPSPPAPRPGTNGTLRARLRVLCSRRAGWI